MARLFLLLGCLTTFGIAFGYPRLHIIDGEPVSPHKYPWVVTVITVDWKNASGSVGGDCGGVLLAFDKDDTQSDVVLTAAHCVTRCDPLMSELVKKCKPSSKKIDADKLTIIAGNHYQSKIDKGEKEVRASRLEIYPTFEVNPAVPIDDIALVKLSEPIVFTKTIRPAYLPRPNESVKDAKNCIVAGWGYTTAENQKDVKRTEELYAVNIGKIYDDDRCGDFHFEIPRDKRDRAFCAEAENQEATACSGDSGSPLWCSSEDKNRPVVYGVVSAGSFVCGGSKPTAFGAVSKYVEWINDANERLKKVE